MNGRTLRILRDNTAQAGQGAGTNLPAALRLRSAWVLGERLHRWLVICLRMLNLKLSAFWPFVPLSSAKGGCQPLGGTTHPMPNLGAMLSQLGAAGETEPPFELSPGLD